MKKHSANAERKRRSKANRARLRDRFKTAEEVEPPSSLLAFAGLKNFLSLNPRTVAGSALTAIALLCLVSLGYLLAHDYDYAAQICKLDSAELRTVASARDLESKKPTELHSELKQIIKNAPMSKMIDYIARKDRAVAAYIVGIAMKESKFGTYAPRKNGADCYNYWGYRGKENTTKSGYSCFDSPAHAVAVVGGKIESMLSNGPRTPAQMISWKCGSSCAGHDPASVNKWISDVSINYYRLNPGKKLAKRN
jgi:hypothetical protein